MLQTNLALREFERVKQLSQYNNLKPIHTQIENLMLHVAILRVCKMNESGLPQDLAFILSFCPRFVPCHVKFDPIKGKHNKKPALKNWINITPEQSQNLLTTKQFENRKRNGAVCNRPRPEERAPGRNRRGRSI